MRKFLNKRWLLLAALGLFLLAIIGFLGYRLIPHSFSGTLLNSPQRAYDFKFTDSTGKDVRLSDFRGKVVLVFFGYTHCPDVCPTTIIKLHQVLDNLGSQAKNVQVIFVTVDPERDTPERMSNYVNRIDSRIIGLSGNPAVTDETATRYGIFFEKGTPDSKGNYEVKHTATVSLIDPQGYLKVVYPYEAKTDSVTSDVRYILSH